MRRDTESAAAARSLNRSDSAFAEHAAVGAEYELLDQTIEAGVTRRCNVALGLLVVVNDFLRPLDAVQDRRIAVVVLIDTDTQIDFPRELVCAEQLHDAENRIGRQWLELIEH